MGKPSIFSRDYDKRMRKRKRIIRSLIIIVVVGSLISIIALIGKFGFKDSKDKIFSLFKTENKANNEKQNDDAKKNITNNDEAEKNDPTKENITKDEAVEEIVEEEKVVEETSKQESLEIPLPSGEKAIAFINVNEGVKTFDKVELNDNLYDINPSKSIVVILDSSTQNLILADIYGQQWGITKQGHKSSKGKTYTKENRIGKYPGFIWNEIPRFLNDNEIVYVSQLPLLSVKPNKYLWRYSITNDSHNMIKGKYYGEKIEIGKLSEEGLEVIIDGNKQVIK